MPELPEVETVVRSIRPKLRGLKIQQATLCGYKPVIGNYSIQQLNKAIKGQKIQDVVRRGKHILIVLENGCIDIHLRMTGQILLQKNLPAYTTFILKLNQQNLYFADTRKFGKVLYHESIEKLDAKLGVEPLGPHFTLDFLRNILKSRKRMMKPLLLDQKLIAGIGNIYADEALFAAGISPRQLSSRVSDEQIKTLHREIRRILTRAINFQGTTFINFAYGEDQSGNFQKLLKVFDREGLPCKRCKTVIKKIWVGQRGTHFCPKCQKSR